MLDDKNKVLLNKIEELLEKKALRRSLLFLGGLLTACNDTLFLGAGSKSNRKDGRSIDSNATANPVGGSPESVAGVGADSTGGLAGSGDAGLSGDGLFDAKPASGSSQTSETCPAIERQINLASLTVAEPPYQANFKLYGEARDAIMGIDFPTYNNGGALQLVGFYIAKTNGRLLLQHVMTSADLNGTRLHAMALENLNFGSGTVSFVVVTLLSDGSMRKQVVESPNFETMFNGKQVVALTRTSVASDFFSNQAIPNFNANKTADMAASSDVYNFSASRISGLPRKLYTAQVGSTYSVAAGLANTTITDIAGNNLGSGNSFADILNYPIFVCYREANGKCYRSIVKLH